MRILDTVCVQSIFWHKKQKHDVHIAVSRVSAASSRHFCLETCSLVFSRWSTWPPYSSTGWNSFSPWNSRMVPLIRKCHQCHKVVNKCFFARLRRPCPDVRGCFYKHRFFCAVWLFVHMQTEFRVTKPRVFGKLVTCVRKGRPHVWLPLVVRHCRCCCWASHVPFPAFLQASDWPTSCWLLYRLCRHLLVDIAWQAACGQDYFKIPSVCFLTEVKKKKKNLLPKARISFLQKFILL